MKSTKCSQCGLVNFAEAPTCRRCNYRFQENYLSAYPNQGTFDQPATNSYGYSNSAYESQPRPYVDTGAAVRKMVIGALFAVGGTIATLVTYNTSSGGGKYVVFWGAILFGVIDFVIGLSSYINSKN